MEGVEKIQIFGATPSPYTQKMISVFRYKHIAYEAFMGNVVGRLHKLNIVKTQMTQHTLINFRRNTSYITYIN